MTTHHRVTGPRENPKVCWRVGCHDLADQARHGRFYCAAHAPKYPRVTTAHVSAARRAMSAGGELTEIAANLGVLKIDLDKALWASLGRSSDREAS